jgi:heme-degrading monooxygenase HmoA
VSAATGLARVVRTPSPPYYAVTTTTELAPGFDRTAYFDLGTQLYADAHRIDGFLGLEAFFEGGAAIAVSYWSSLEAIERWRRHADHLRAKDLARTTWFGRCMTRIAKVERDYGFHLEPAHKDLGAP